MGARAIPEWVVPERLAPFAGSPSARGASDAAGGATDFPAARALSVAPMLDRTDRHFRRFLRLISRQVGLYSEMVTTGALLRGPRERLLAHDPAERPLALQLGGDDPVALVECAAMGEQAGFDEINLNVGCPSDRVRQGAFGAVLMRQPQRVADCVAAMRARVGIPVTVKHRIGVDELDRYEDMAQFVETVAAAGCDAFIVHARKAWLAGLSPKENREIPPLRHGEVHRLKSEFPGLRIVINGGLRDLEGLRFHLDRVDGAMIGRAAWDDPYLLSRADREVFGDASRPPRTRRDLVVRFAAYLERQDRDSVSMPRIAAQISGLFHGEPGSAVWRRALAEQCRGPGAGPTALLRALAALEAARDLPRAPVRSRA